MNHTKIKINEHSSKKLNKKILLLFAFILFLLLLISNVYAATSIELTTSIILTLLIIKIIKESGFLNLNDYFPKTKAINISSYLNISFLCKAAEAQSGRAPSYQLGVFPKDVRVQNSQPRVESPVRGALNKHIISIITLFLFSLLLSTNVFAATSIELTTSDWINVFGNLNLTGRNLLNAGNVSITGNLSVSGNASFGTNALFIDATNNLVGIGTTQPSSKPHVNDFVIVRRK